VYLVLLESSHWVKFNKIYFIISYLRWGWYWLLNEFYCWKFKQITANWVIKGKWVECVHTWGQQHILAYLSMKEGGLFCFVIMISPKPWCLKYVMELIIKKFSMNRGAMTWFRMFRTTMWNLLIIEPFFHWIVWKIKIENYIGIWGCYWYHWKTFTKFDF
jgi:hypothetical protein